MAILSEDECRAIMKKALSYSKADECEVNLNGSDSANIRYARNTVSTSGAISSTTMAISSAFGKKLGVITLNEYTDAAIESAVRKSEELAKLAPENPEYMPFLGPQTYAPPAKTFVPETASCKAVPALAL
jgi:predicted Zn-dependent protease